MSHTLQCPNNNTLISVKLPTPTRYYTITLLHCYIVTSLHHTSYNMNHLNYTVDYKNTVFEKPELTHIHGEPTMANLFTLRNELQTNAQAVSTMLGEGKYGHLGLVMTPQDYAL